MIDESRSTRPPEVLLSVCLFWAILLVAWLAGSTGTYATSEQEQNTFPTANPIGLTTAAYFSGQDDTATQYAIELRDGPGGNEFRTFHTQEFTYSRSSNGYVFPPRGPIWTLGQSIPVALGGSFPTDRGRIDANNFVCFTYNNSSSHLVETCYNPADPADSTTVSLDETGTIWSGRMVRIASGHVVVAHDTSPFPLANIRTWYRASGATSWTAHPPSSPPMQCDSVLDHRHYGVDGNRFGDNVYVGCHGIQNALAYTIDGLTGARVWTRALGVAGSSDTSYDYFMVRTCGATNNVWYRWVNQFTGITLRTMAYGADNPAGPFRLTFPSELSPSAGAPGDVPFAACDGIISHLRQPRPGGGTTSVLTYWGDGKQEPVVREHADLTKDTWFANASAQPDSVVGASWGSNPSVAAGNQNLGPRSEEEPGPATQEIRFGLVDVPIFFHNFETGDARYWSSTAGLQ